MLHVHLFGVPAVRRNDSPLPMSSQMLGLLACLLLSPRRAHPRPLLAGLFWPDVPEDRSRRNLSNALYRLRQTLGDDAPLQATAENVGVRDGATLWVDVAEFRTALAADDLPQAVKLYRGDLLEGHYDDWLLAPRLALRTQALEAMEQLVVAREADGQFAGALRLARRLAQAEPLYEEGHRLVIRLLARLQRRHEALAHYDYLVSLLDDELGVELMPETQALAADIRNEPAAAEPVPLQQGHTPFVGRVEERAAVLAALETALEGSSGRVCAIEGAPGIGKSRMLCELAGGALWRGMAIAGGNVMEQPTPSPFSPLAVALNTALAGPRATQIEMLLPATTLAALAPLYAPWRDLAPLPNLPPRQARDRFHRALADVWQTLGDLTPHLLFFDDLQWAAPALWEALDVLVQALPKSRVFLLLAYRRPAIEQSAGWATLQRWERESRLTAVGLNPLDRAEVEQLLPPAKRDRLDEVMTTTGGNPFFVTEALDVLEKGRPLPDALLPAHMAALSPETQVALESAAVIGTKVPYRLWAAVSEMDPFALAAAAEQLADNQLLRPVPLGFIFSHNLLQEAVYDGMDSSRRRQLHHQAARALADENKGGLRTRAYHLDRAGDKEAAAAVYRQAGEQKLALFAFAEAQSAFERSLALLPPTPSRARVETLLAYARACEITGDVAKQGETLDAALREARALHEEALLAEAIMRAEAYRAGQGQAEAESGAVETHEAMTAGGRRKTVTLARQDAPLGRPLAAGEKVTLRWTLEAPEDATVTGKAPRRRYVLRRLLAEAEAAGAAPTDSDLADALGVSRHTILRDMDALAQAGTTLPTRRRRRILPQK